MSVSVWLSVSEGLEESDWTLADRRVGGGLTGVMVSVVKALEVV